VLGVDGCRGGWVAVSRDGRRLECRVVESLAELVEALPRRSAVAIDIPIGLPERGARACDLEARKTLGAKRGTSVFPAPIRPVLAARSQAEAARIGRRVEGRGVGVQLFGILAKIREVDELLRASPKARAVLYETHPELSLLHLNGGKPMRFPKQGEAGRRERQSLLAGWCGGGVDALVAERPPRCAADDVLDALALLWSAERIARGAACSLPARPPRDAFGLRMSIRA